jgi:hypothetical protein
MVSFLEGEIEAKVDTVKVILLILPAYVGILSSFVASDVAA